VMIYRTELPVTIQKSPRPLLFPRIPGYEAATIRYPNPVEGTLEAQKEQEHFCA